MVGPATRCYCCCEDGTKAMGVSLLSWPQVQDIATYIVQERRDTNDICISTRGFFVQQWYLFLDALAGRANDGEHHGQEANSGEEPQRGHDGKGLRHINPNQMDGSCWAREHWSGD